MSETKTSNTVDAAAYSAQGTSRDRVALPADTFDGTVNLPVMHQAVKAFLANQRQGNASTKTRGEVIGGNSKPWKQKGTGRARQGSIRAPNWVGGGTVFGPRPRKYTETVPKQIRALARKSALNARARENSLFIIDAFNYEAPKTAKLQQLLARLELAHRKVLILTDGVKQNVFLSGRNIPLAHVMPYSDVSTYHVLWAEYVLIESSALGEAMSPLKEKELADVKVVRYVERSAKPEAGSAEAGDDERAPKSKSKKKTAVKAAAKKAPAKKAAAKKPAAKAAAKKAPAKKAAPKKKGK